MKHLNGAFQLFGSGAHCVVGGRNVVALQKPLGKTLACLQHGGGTSRTEHAHPEIVHCVDDTEGERKFRANDGEVRPLFDRDTHQDFKIFQIDGDTAGYLGDAAIAGRTDDLGDSLVALNRPGQRMLAASRTKDQDFHRCFPALVLSMT